MARLRLALALALAAMLLPVAAARASIPLQNPVARPLDTTQATAPSRFRLHVDLGGAEHIKDMTTQLPLGISPYLFQPTCSVDAFTADNCPTNSRIGSTTVNLTVMSLLQQNVDGRIYYLSPTPQDAFPGLGIILDPDPPAPKAFQRGRTRISPETGGLETVINNFPRDSGGIPIRLNSLDIVLFASFISNPAACDPATTNFLVTSYEDPSTTSRISDTFTPTGCSPPPVPRCSGRRATKAGTSGRDVLNGTARRDVIVARAGNDTIRGFGGNDLLCGGAGPDQIFGGAGKDTLLGGPGPDSLFGGAGTDILRGGGGANNEHQ